MLQENVLIGEGSVVGRNTKISNSTIGKNVTIGRTACAKITFTMPIYQKRAECVYNVPYVSGNDVHIDGAYIWDGCTIADGCRLQRCVIDKHVTLAEGVHVKSGCVIGPRVSCKSLFSFFNERISVT